MGLEQQVPEPFDPRELSDKELIQRFCPERSNQALADELWRRYQQAVYAALENNSRTLCPAFYDFRDLVHDSYLQARKNLLARICTFKELGSAPSLRAWLGRVARSTMLDERRKVTHSRTKNKIIEVSIEQPPTDNYGEERPPEVTEESLLELPVISAERVHAVEEPTVTAISGSVSFNETFEPKSHHEYFRSRYSTSPLAPSAPVEWKLVEQQRQFIFREILTRHAQQSDENTTCAAMIRLRYWRKWPVTTLVEHFYGKPVSEQQSKARHRAYYRLLDRDYKEITAALGRTLDIVRPEQI